MSTRQELIDAIEAKVAAGATVVASVAALIGGFVQAARDAIDDPEELQAILDQIDAQQNVLATAVASGTAAEDEAPVPQTGGEDSGDGSVTGSENTVGGGEGGDTLSGGAGDDQIEG